MTYRIHPATKREEIAARIWKAVAQAKRSPDCANDHPGIVDFLACCRIANETGIDVAQVVELFTEGRAVVIREIAKMRDTEN